MHYCRHADRRLPNDLDAIRALVSRLSSERDAAIGQSRLLSEQNDQLRHLMKQLQRAQFGARPERLDRDQLQLALEDMETSSLNRTRTRRRSKGRTRRRTRTGRGDRTAARCRRIFPTSMSRSSPTAPFARAAMARCR